jgi:hypothetical protein
LNTIICQDRLGTDFRRVGKTMAFVQVTTARERAGPRAGAGAAAAAAAAGVARGGAAACSGVSGASRWPRARKRRRRWRRRRRRRRRKRPLPIGAKTVLFLSLVPDN